MTDIRTEFCGFKLDNPVIVPAGAHGRDAETIVQVGDSGVSAVVTKTITAQAPPDVRPCFSAVKAGMVNSVFGSDKPAEYWFAEGIKKREKRKSPGYWPILPGFTLNRRLNSPKKPPTAGPT